MSFGKKVPYKHKSVAQSFGIDKSAFRDGGTAIKTSGSQTPTPSGGAGMKSVGSPKFGFSTAGRKEPALKQADPDSSMKAETYPFVGRQAGKGRAGINSHKAPANFVPAPNPKAAKGTASPRSVNKFFGSPAKSPGKIAKNFV